MKPLVLSNAPPTDFTKKGAFCDLAIYTGNFRFVWGPPPLQDELTAHHGPGPDVPGHKSGAMHWSDWGIRWGQSENRKHRDLSFADFCELYETVELWFDIRAESQLELLWLLDYFRGYPKAAAKLKLRLVNLDLIWAGSGELVDWRPPVVDVTERELATASAAWQAYRSPAPEACVGLLQQDLSALPLLKPALLDLLAELPSASSGLGASEMRMLEMIGRGYALTNDLFHNYEVRRTFVFSEYEYGYLLDGLAFGPTPAVAGLNDQLRTMRRDNLRDRVPAYQRSRLSLTEFGKAVVAHKEDFSRTTRSTAGGAART